MTAITTYLSITLTINCPSYPIKRHRLTEWITKQKPSLCCLQEKQLQREASPLSARMDKGLQSDKTRRYEGVTLLMPEKWTSKLTGQDNEGCFTLIRANQPTRWCYTKWICTEFWFTHYHKKCATGLKTHININQLIESDFNTPISSNN